MKFIINEYKVKLLFTSLQSGKYFFNQKEKAELIGVSQSVISRLESGQKKFGELKAHHYLKVCEALEVHPSETLILKDQQNENN